MKHRVLFAMATVACLIVSSAGSAFAATALDAQQTDTSGYTDTWQYTNLRLAQWFKGGTTGQLTSVAIDANSYGQQIEFEVLGATTDDQFVSSVSGWTTITLNSPLSVLTGGTYYILLTVPNKFQWLGECSSAYSGGKAEALYQNAYSTVPAFGIAHSGTLGTLGTYCTQAFAFKTYVTTPDVANPVPTQVATPVPTAKAASSAGAKATATAAASPSASASGASASPSAVAATETPSASDTTGTSAAQATPTASAEPTTPQGNSSGGSPILFFLLAAVLAVAVVGGGGWFYMSRRSRQPG